MKNYIFKFQIFILLFFYSPAYSQITNYIYTINKTANGFFYFSKIEISTGAITNLQMIPSGGLSLSSSSTINNYSQKYYLCTGDSLITFDAISGAILSDVALPIPPAAEMYHIQFNPCDSNIYGILNNYPTSISFVRYHIAGNTITTISSLNPGTFFCPYCGSFLNPVTGIYGFLNLNINGLDVSTGQVIFSNAVNDLPNESFQNIALKCSTHEIFGISTDYIAGINYLSTINPNTGNITHVSTTGWTPGLTAIAGGSTLINQLTGNYYYTAFDTLIGANTVSGNMTYNQTINSGDLYLIQHFSPCACGPNGINTFNNNMVMDLSPNPSDGNFTIYFNDNTSEKAIRIFDVTGNIIYQKDKVKDADLQINLTDFSKGIYFVKAFSGDSVTVNKIVIQ